MLGFALVCVGFGLSEELIFVAALFLLFTELFGIDVQTARPDPVLLLLVTLRVVRLRLRLLFLLEVASLLLDLFFEEFTADAEVRVVEYLVEVLADLDCPLLQQRVQLVDCGELGGVVFQKSLMRAFVSD